MENTVKLEIPESRWNELLNAGALNPSALKEVKINDDFLKDDEVYQSLKRTSNKAYKDVVTYRFNKLNNIQSK
jgi:hypothetical protein